MRTFDSGATRDGDKDKIDPESAFSPLVLEAYCTYIRKHRLDASGKPRSDDNWQKGIPRSSYMKSLWRHFLEAWRLHRDPRPVALDEIRDALFGVIFNTHGYLHEIEIIKRFAPPIPTETKPLSYSEAQKIWIKHQKSMTASVQQPSDDWSETVQGELKGLVVPQSGPKSS